MAALRHLRRASDRRPVRVVAGLLWQLFKRGSSVPGCQVVVVRVGNGGERERAAGRLQQVLAHVMSWCGLTPQGYASSLHRC